MKINLGYILRQVSLGQYNTKLYYDNGKRAYSKKIGGLFTIIVAFLVICASFGIFYQTFFWTNYEQTTSYIDLSSLKGTLKIKDFIALLPYLNIQVLQSVKQGSSSMVDCTKKFIGFKTSNNVTDFTLSNNSLGYYPEF